MPYLTQGRVLLLALFSLITLLLLFSWQSWRSSREAVDLELAHLNSVVTHNSAALQKKRYERLRSIGIKLSTLLEAGREDDARTLLNDLRDVAGGLESIVYLNADGSARLFASDYDDIAAALPDMTQFQTEIERTLALGGMATGVPAWDGRSGQWLVPLFVAVPAVSGAGPAVIATWLSLQERIDSWSSLTLGQNTSIAVIGQDGISRYVAPDFSVFANPAGRTLFSTINDGISASDKSSGLLDVVYHGGEGEIRYRVHYAALGSGLFSLVMRPHDRYIDAFLATIQPAIWLFLLLTVITVGIHMVVARQQRRYHARLEFEAHHDPLTGLLNRSRLLHMMTHSLQEDQRQPMTLVLINIDHFNRVNDQHGHSLGDAVLQQIPQRLRSVVANDDWIGRHSGDEFIVVLRSSASLRGEDMLVMAMQAALQEPFVIGSRTIVLGASLGVARYPLDGTAAEDILGKADAALHKAKADGRGQIVNYSSSIAHLLQREKLLEQELNGCVGRGEIRVHYQPQVNCRSGELTGAEALVRWYNPKLGSVSPAEFIPVAENMGLIRDIDRHVLREACGFVQRMSELSQKALRISVNLSATHLLDSSLLEEIRSAVNNFALEPEQLVLEITETAMLNDFERAAQQLHQLRALGVGVSVDDFGTGYSSLAYIHRLPVTEIKIDRSFVDQITSDLHDRALTSAIIAMGKRLHLEVVAEGVEDASQWQILQDQHCDTIQGYHVARPMTADDFIVFARNARVNASARQVAASR